MKYEKPDLEELELVLEGSFLLAATANIGGDKEDKDPWEGEFED